MSNVSSSPNGLVEVMEEKFEALLSSPSRAWLAEAKKVFESQRSALLEISGDAEDRHSANECSSETADSDAPLEKSNEESNHVELPLNQMKPMTGLHECDSSEEGVDSDLKKQAVDVERHARDFMEAAKKLQLYFIGLQREDQPTKAEKLRKEIADMEEELKVKKELIKKHETLLRGWRKEAKDQLDKHHAELDRV